MLIEVPKGKKLPKGATDALFWAGYLKDKEDEIDIFVSPKPKKVKKK